VKLYFAGVAGVAAGAVAAGADIDFSGHEPPAQVDLVRYLTKNGGHGGGTEFSRELEWSGVEFVKRVAALVPPARRHMVRY